MRVGAALRAVRIRRGLRQTDVALKAGVASGTISNLERGRLGGTTLERLRRVAAALEVRLDVVARWRGGELDRLLNSRHSMLSTAVIELLSGVGWRAAPEVSFSIYGERGFIDVLAWHEPTRSMLVIELKTEVIEVNELLGVLDRKTRLARSVGRERGWAAMTVSTWLVIAESSTNRARVKAVDAMLRAALPTRGAAVKTWLRAPSGRMAGLAFFQNFSGRSGKQALTGQQRVRVARSRSAPRPNHEKESC